MIYIWSTLLVMLNTVWLFLVLFGLPGNWLIIISTMLFAWRYAEAGVFSGWTLVVITVLASLGEVVEFLAAATGAKSSGASLLGSAAAIAGAVIGAAVGTFSIPIPLIGTLIGACCGAAIAASAVGLIKGDKADEFLRHGIGAGTGEFLGITSKLALGVLIWLIVAVAVFWP